MRFDSDPSLAGHASAGRRTGEIRPAARGVDQGFRCVAYPGGGHHEGTVAFDSLYRAIVARLNSSFAAGIPQRRIQIEARNARSWRSDLRAENRTVGENSSLGNSRRTGNKMSMLRRQQVAQEIERLSGNK